MNLPKVARLAGLLFVLIAACMVTTNSAAGQNESDLRQQAIALLDQMTVPERIGQLFLVTFQGDRAPNDSDIANLILNYQIGGVVLLAENDNLTGYGVPAAAPSQVRDLNRNLQSLALRGYSEDLVEVAEPDGDNLPTTTPAPQITNVQIPLLIATQQDGDSLPLTNILTGFTDLPNNMAIGATWNPENARIIGEVAGKELASTGFNLLLGPSLDVLERPMTFNTSDLGTNSFGGDPYWVGLMGQAYLNGVYAGSDGRLATSPKSFPGKGSSDRSVAEEVPTVRRSLEQLKQIELAPFFTITRDPLGSPNTASALLITHIRYQGYQGNIRATTAPISLDPQALNSLMALPEFVAWRQGGGVIISDNLGARSIESFYDDTRQEFPHRQVAKDALVAGNDLLYVADFALGKGNYEAELANIIDTVTWFQDRYQIDPSFQQRVDEAVLRTLMLKLRLYGSDFSFENIIGQSDEVANPSQPFPSESSSSFFNIAESAITLLSPSREELASRLVSPPALNQKIVIFTDVRDVQPCQLCEPISLLGVDELQERILALYGPSGSGQVQPNNVTSFSFADLNEFLDARGVPILPPTPAVIEVTETPESITVETDEAETPTEDETEVVEATPTPAPTPSPTTLPADYRVQEALREANLLVFAPLNAGPNVQAADSEALSRFLSERPDLVSKAQLVVLAFDAPYFLDSTEVSKLTAYYGIYSRTSDFIDAAVRALFLESPLSGRSPVSIEGIQYDLMTQTQPDPEQLIELFFVVEGDITNPSAQETIAAAIGDTLNLRTGVIIDRNGQSVPDGTMVRFVLRDRVQGTVTILGDRPTIRGSAKLDYVLEARMGPGQFRITVESGEALRSQEVDIVIEDEAQLAIIIPTPAPTETPTPTPTPTETPEPTPTSAPTLPTATPELPGNNDEPGLLIGLSALQSLAGIFGGLVAIVMLTNIISHHRGNVTTSQRLRQLLWGVIGGLLIYNYYALGLPGSEWLGGFGGLASIALILTGGLVGTLLYRPVRQK